MGGYRVPFDPRPLLRELESGADLRRCWQELWQGLYHQGDVGEASYAAVPHLVRIYRESGKIDWNTYSLVSAIESARNVGHNPDVPPWLRQGYEEAVKSLAMTGLSELPQAHDAETVRSIFAVIALWKGFRVFARFVGELTDDEWSELASREFGKGYSTRG